MKRFRFTFVLIFMILAIALPFSGCGEEMSTDTPKIQTGTSHKTYGLYEPIHTIENIECDLYYQIPVSEYSWTTFGSSIVDTWNEYKLKEQDDGAFTFDISTEVRDGYQGMTPLQENPYLYCDRSLSCNFNGLSNETFLYRHAYTAESADGGKESLPNYFCLWVVDGLTHDTKEPDYRTWWLRLYVVFEEGPTMLTVHEYAFHRQYICYHDADGNEIFDSPISTDGWIHERFVSQNYIPTMN